MGKEQPDDEVIASNLSKKGSHDLELLLGEWECIKVAYTEDGYTISDVAPIDIEKLKSQGLITIFNFDQNEDFFCYPYYLNFSVSDNRLQFSEYEFEVVPGARFNLFCEHEKDLEIIDFMMNMYSFVIRDDELLVHFTGIEEKNLLIFKKKTYPPPPHLNGTKWKFVGIVDIETGQTKELEPVDCAYCYALTFFSDYQASVHNISSEYNGLDLTPKSINRYPLILFEEKLLTEMYDKDGKYYIVNDFNELLYHIKTCIVTEDELKLYYYEIAGIPPFERTTSIYSLFEKINE